MKKIFSLIFSLALLALVAVPAMAATTKNLIYTPATLGLVNVVGVSSDSAPGYSTGSFTPANTTGPKSEIYISPNDLFDREITLGDIKSISYWTKTSSIHSVDPRDWYLVIYTKPYSDQIGGGWYGTRIGSEPYFSENINDIANTWNKWSTESGSNQLRFFESTYGYFGSYTDPHWASFVTGNSLAGVRGSGVSYSNQPVLWFYIGTGSAWANGFTGKVDGFRVELNDNSVATINLENELPDTTPPSVPTITGFKNPNLTCGSITNAKTVTVDWLDSSDESGITGYEYWINYPKSDGTRGDWKVFFTNSEYRGSLNEGLHIVKVRAKDNAGNFSEWSNECNITADWTAPDVEITNPEDNSIVSGIIDIRGTVKDSNLLRYYFVVENYNGVKVAGPGTVTTAVDFTNKLLLNWNTTNLSDGLYTIKLEARDKANNKDSGSIDWHTVTVKNTPISKDDCKKDGWKTFFTPTFRNQGDCISWLQSSPNAKGNKKDN